tara:strand:+ start:6470 stop:8548 length:2079 start_codon:yes stop_codon:yes gene_type:complete
LPKVNPLSESELQNIVSRAINDSVDFIESEIAPERTLNQEYYNGKTSIGHEEGRSSIVSTKCRDAVNQIKPSLLRVFLSTNSPVEFHPQNMEDVANAQQCTEYVNAKFRQLGGMRILDAAITDALIKSLGIIKVYYSNATKTEIYSYSNLDSTSFDFISAQDDITILEHSKTATMEMDQESGIEVEGFIHDCKISRQTTKGDIAIEPVLPEEFFINRSAKSIDDCYIAGYRVEKRVSDLVDEGFAYEDVVDLGGLTESSSSYLSERDARTGYSTDHDEDMNSADPSSKLVLITEAYMKVDPYQTGQATLHRFILGGSGYKILDMMPCDQMPFALFEAYPIPHTVFGESVVGRLRTDQDASTSVLRSILDNVALVNTPRLSVTPDASLDDCLNNEIGAIIRARTPTAVTPISIPFTAGQTLGALQYLDQLCDNKVGIAQNNIGLNPDALQSTTKQAVAHHVATAQGQIETIARNIAEGGVKTLFKLILRLTVQHADKAEMIRLNNMYVPIDPRVWNIDYDLVTNVGLGTAKQEEKAMALQQVLQIQQTIYQTYGATNGITTLSQIRNTLADMLASVGIHNSERYFMPMTPQIEAQMMQMAQQAAANQPKPVDPGTAMVQGEQMKAQAKMQTDMAKLQADMQKHAMDDDLKRDEMDQDLVIKAAELLSKHGIALDQAKIKEMQAGMRQPGGAVQ